MVFVHNSGLCVNLAVGSTLGLLFQVALAFLMVFEVLFAHTQIVTQTVMVSMIHSSGLCVNTGVDVAFRLALASFAR